MNSKALIFDIYKGSTNDGPGMRDTVFLKGCPLNCVWCHNPEGISYENAFRFDKEKCIGCGICNTDDFETELCPTGARCMVASEYSAEQLADIIIRDKEYFDVSGGGVTLSGGEAATHPDFSTEFFRLMKIKDVHTALDTSGFCEWDGLQRILEYTDLVLYDLKTIDDTKHRKWTGVSNELILDNILKTEKNIWIRTPVIPGYTDNSGIIEEIADFLKNMPVKPERWELCAFNNSCSAKYEKLGIDWHLKDAPLIKSDIMELLVSVAKKSLVPEILYTGIVGQNT